MEKANTPLLKASRKEATRRHSSKPSLRICLATFRDAPLRDAYDVYQHLMDYWAETMQDDCYAFISQQSMWPNPT
jgi:type I restriction enzyme M protein